MSDNSNYHTDQYGALDLPNSHPNPTDDSNDADDISDRMSRCSVSSGSTNLSSCSMRPFSSRWIDNSRLLGETSSIAMNSSSALLSKNLSSVLGNSNKKVSTSSISSCGSVDKSSSVLKKISATAKSSIAISKSWVGNEERSKRSLVNLGTSTSGIAPSKRSLNQLNTSEETVYSHKKFRRANRDQVNVGASGISGSKYSLSKVNDSNQMVRNVSASQVNSTGFKPFRPWESSSALVAAPPSGSNMIRHSNVGLTQQPGYINFV